MQQGEKIYVFKPRVTQAIPNQKLEWLGHLLVPGLFDGRHFLSLKLSARSRHTLYRASISAAYCTKWCWPVSVKIHSVALTP